MKKYSKKWMQTYIAGKLPEDNGVIIEKISKHAFEVEDVDVVGEGENADSLFEIKVLPNRVSDAYNLRGMAREFATVFDLPLVDHSTSMLKDISNIELKNDFVEIQNPATKCYFGISVTIPKQIPTPDWIKDIAEKSGGRSINSLVDLTNLMLFGFGQPTHVFDMDKVKGKIITRLAKAGEKITLLDGKVLELTGIENLICAKDQNSENILALAGVKGGKVGEVDANTTNAFFEIANFDADTVRLASLKQNLRTDASKIYENSLSLHTTEEVLIILVNTIKDVYPEAKINFIAKQYADPSFENYLTENKNAKISFTVHDVERSAGIPISKEEIVKILKRLNFAILENSLEENGDSFVIQGHKDRLDINIKEDLLEEILRIYGFDNIPGIPLKVDNNYFTHNQRFLLENFLKNFFCGKGFTEVYNYTFVPQGDLKVLLPLAEDKSYLRNNLIEGGILAYQRNYNYLPIMQTDMVKFFEIGSVFLKDKEERRVVICLEDGKKKSKNLETLENLVKDLGTALNTKIEMISKSEKPALVEFSLDKLLEQDLNLVYVDFGKELKDIKYKTISIYPFIVRDVATWVPENFDFEHLKENLLKLGLQNVEKVYLFDSFTKEGRTSVAFRIIFQSYSETLTDEKVEVEMGKVNSYLKENNFEIR